MNFGNKWFLVKFFFPCGRFSFQQKNEKVVSWEKCCLSFGEKVTTMKIRTSKTKKNIKKSSKHQNIESIFLVHHYYDINTSKLTKITTTKVVDHYYENQNIEKNEKNIESLSFVWFSHFDYLRRKYLWRFGKKKNLKLSNLT